MPQAQATLSLIDLAELKVRCRAPSRPFARSTDGLIDQKQFKTVSDARADAKEFAPSSQINQIDLIDFAESLGTPEARIARRVPCAGASSTTARPRTSPTPTEYPSTSRTTLSQLNATLSTYTRSASPRVRRVHS